MKSLERGDKMENYEIRLPISKKLRDELKYYGRKTQSYNDIIQDLLNKARGM